jgi:hypothetical protein
MSETAGVILMMNNYFHDVATALLLASGIAIWVIYKKFGDSDKPDVREYFLKLYGSMTFLVKFSFAWIILGGIPRTYFYTEFEWSHYAGKSQIPALIVKHILAFLFVGAGAYLWINIRKKVKEIKESNSR